MNRYTRRTRTAAATSTLQTDPRGRLDIALVKMLNLGVTLHGDPSLQMAYEAFRPQIENGIRDIVGPQTTVGNAAKRAVRTLHAIVNTLEGGKGGDAA